PGPRSSGWPSGCAHEMRNQMPRDKVIRDPRWTRKVPMPSAGGRRPTQTRKHPLRPAGSPPYPEPLKSQRAWHRVAQPCRSLALRSCARGLVIAAGGASAAASAPCEATGASELPVFALLQARQLAPGCLQVGVAQLRLDLALRGPATSNSLVAAARAA